MDPDQLLQSLGVNLGLPNLRFDANGCARLAIEGAPALDFERDAAGAIQVYSVLGPLPQQGREALYERLLKGNLFGASTAGSSLAIDDLHGEIVLCRTVLAAPASAQSFASEIEAFVNAAEDWQGRLADGSGDGSSGAQPHAVPQMMEHFLRG